MGLAVFAGTEASDQVDRAVLLWITSLRTPAVETVVWGITLAAGPLVSSALAIVLAIVLARREGARGLAPLLLAGGFALEYALKQLVYQPSPPSELTRDAAFIPAMRDLSAFSFPDGGSLRATFLALLVAGRRPEWRVLLWFVVALIAVARLYLATGWVTDVLGGIACGAFLASLAEVVTSRLPRVGAASQLDHASSRS